MNEDLRCPKCARGGIESPLERRQAWSGGKRSTVLHCERCDHIAMEPRPPQIDRVREGQRRLV